MSDLEEFRKSVTSYSSLDREIKTIGDQLKPLNDRLRELKIRKSEIQGNICEFMSKNEIDTCNTQNGTLHYKQSRITKPLTMNEIKDNMRRFFFEIPDNFNNLDSSARGELLVSFVYDNNREVTVKGCLRSNIK